MLPTTPEFDAAADSNTTEADARVRIYREFNAIAPSITVSAVHDPIEGRFNEEAVVSIRNPKKNGISYGPLREFFSSNNPNKGFRFILNQDFDAEVNARYYIPKLSVNDTSADVTVDYTQNYTMNQIIVRYENTRNSTTFYNETIKVYITPNGGAESLVFTGTMNTDGVSTVNYNGTTWGEGQDFTDTTVNVRKVRVVFTKGTWKHQPRIMYIGGVHALDVSSDVIAVTVDKSEFERDALMPIGQPSANTCRIELDNTGLDYRFSSSLDEDFFLKHQQIEIEFGLNTKYGGGADSFEYVKGGVFYVDSYGYSESSMTVEITGRDYASVLQERFCGNYLWEGVSVKHIVYDVLARSGVSLNSVIFDFGIAGNAAETNIRSYVWSHESQTVWDFLTQLAKSELGTVFFDEEENLVFTDRLDIDSKFLAGSQYTITENVNLESIEEDFEIVANRVKVGWEELKLNSSRFNADSVLDRDGNFSYSEGAEVLLNQILWQPNSDESYLGSATLARNLGVNDTHIYVTADTSLQISRDEGEVLIGDEFITYRDRTVLGNGSVRLKIVKRNARKNLSGAKKHLGVNGNYGLKTGTMWARSAFNGTPVPAIRVNTADGFQTRLRSRNSKYTRAIYTNIYNSSSISYNTKYTVYHCRFRFNDQGGTWREDDCGGMFINLDSKGQGIFFEVSNPENPAFVHSGGNKIGNARAYKANRALTVVPMPPAPDSAGDYATDFLFAKAKGREDGTYVDLTVVQESQSGYDRIVWYVNGQRINSFNTGNSRTYLSGLGYNSGQVAVGNAGNERGYFGTFIRGSTSMTVDFIYATNNQSVGPENLLDRGLETYYDSRRRSYNERNRAQTLSDLEYYVEFGAPVHEVIQLKVDHDSYPTSTASILNTAEESVKVLKATHSPFNSNILLANSSRIGVNLNDTVFYQDGSELDHSFFVYGVSIIRSDSEDITTSDGPSIRRYGVEEVEFINPWVNTKKHAVSLAKYIRKFWSEGQQHFTASVFPNPAIQPRDRVSLSYPDKGLTGGDAWFVNGVTITYDGGLSCSLKLKRFKDYPDVNDNIDYREDGGINIT